MRRRLLLPFAAMAAATLFAPARAAAPAGVSFDHVALYVSDLGKSVAYYQRVFGLAEIPARVPGPRWLDLGNGLALHLQPGRTGPLATSVRTHVALRVADMPAFLDHLTALKEPWFGRDGNLGKIENRRTDALRQIYLRDPDGYWIEVNGALAS